MGRLGSADWVRESQFNNKDATFFSLLFLAVP